ncbi:hypothetical protein SAMN06269185_1315 [Natronoarchaeum philippinense]|uniref:Uncharacterized protein n=2 Tax=Natronoarchaeum philippinense TaxID=558529 RepID=A0A285NBM0_NATPI|nr:hypothetical protein SAMN06269185_1315 [Natronoarchaeum philippinense]
MIGSAFRRVRPILVTFALLAVTTGTAIAARDGLTALGYEELTTGLSGQALFAASFATGFVVLFALLTFWYARRD